MSKSIFFYLIAVSCISACSSNKIKSASHLDFKQSEALFDKEFPRKWPRKKIAESFTDKQNYVLIQMTNSLSQFLKNRKIEFKQINPTALIISPTGEAKINKTANSLSDDNITIEYDAKYFARNPFSAGTFNEDQAKVILSHRAFGDEKLSKQILAHELVHVATFKNKQRKVPSPFYCQFKGEQFKPHLLSCDEMNAYNSDIKRYLKSGLSKEALNSKIAAAKMHTIPIPELIKKLDLKSTKHKNDLIQVEGKNAKGHFWVEFPVFSIKSKSKDTQQIAKAYLENVKLTAMKFSKYINEIEQANN